MGFIQLFLKSIIIFLLSTFTIFATEMNALESGKSVLQKMTGCYLIDYSYSETEVLKEGYPLDTRVYDVNRDKSMKEWIYLENVSQTEFRLQHVLFATDLNGNYLNGTLLKHQSEDWEFNAPFSYEFQKPLTWFVKKHDQASMQNLWTRKITNLDDGLRYQCSASWNTFTLYPEWTCSNFAPIPGRETRDMGRKDYNTLDRTTRLIAYGTNWLERQDNIKTLYQNGVKTPLVKETGKNWYIRLPDSECQMAQNFASDRIEFWNLLRDTWREVFIGDRDFIEQIPPGEGPRFFQMFDLEEKYLKENLKDASVRASARNDILNLIQKYRVP